MKTKTISYILTLSALGALVLLTGLPSSSSVPVYFGREDLNSIPIMEAAVDFSQQRVHLKAIVQIPEQKASQTAILYAYRKGVRENQTIGGGVLPGEPILIGVKQENIRLPLFRGSIPQAVTGQHRYQYQAIKSFAQLGITEPGTYFFTLQINPAQPIQRTISITIPRQGEAVTGEKNTSGITTTLNTFTIRKTSANTWVASFTARVQSPNDLSSFLSSLSASMTHSPTEAVIPPPSSGGYVAAVMPMPVALGFSNIPSINLNIRRAQSRAGHIALIQGHTTLTRNQGGDKPGMYLKDHAPGVVWTLNLNSGGQNVNLTNNTRSIPANEVLPRSSIALPPPTPTPIPTSPPVLPPKGGPRPQFPSHWGPIPNPQTADIRPLPGGYGQGSTTMYNWINANLEKDKTRVTVVGRERHGGRITVPRNQILEIRLPENPSTGYRWEVLAIQGLKKTDDFFQQPQSSSPIVGQSGERVIRVISESNGSVSILLKTPGALSTVGNDVFTGGAHIAERFLLEVSTQ